MLITPILFMNDFSLIPLTILSRIVKCYTRKEYSHVSIALDENLEEMYSFGRINPYVAFIGGFVHEQIDKRHFQEI